MAIVVGLVIQLLRLWRRQPVDFSAGEPGWFVAAVTVTCLAVVSYGLVWPSILRRLGARPPSGAIAIFLVGQMGKYLPGSVWHYAGRVALARSRGLPARTTLLSLAVEVAASTVAAVLVGLFVLPWSVALPAALAAVGLVGLARHKQARQRLATLASRVPQLRGTEVGAAVRTAPGVVPLYVLVWVAYGLALWLTSRALFATPVSDLPYFAAVFALGWVAGMLVVFAPGGIGVREAVLVALLAPKLGEAEAIVLAGASRVLLTAADALGGAAGFALWRRARLEIGP